MTYELDPQMPEEFDGDLTSTFNGDRVGSVGFPGRANGSLPGVGDLSDLNEDDKRLYDQFLASLR
ncbi:hypothetical protein DFR70_13233 [Nocardia tenerifensis]|uniref:Uncharacterized protein n=1 Tax=Nocardia tenerifensis TaxID=228006 RepID=A0A318JN64_9NOCA|nr:hypothetical protein [Nocardia tenerifensis]PXX52648.1 hypothetical protein DFR70_13233 [Nocardia tenerifensis]